MFGLSRGVSAKTSGKSAVGAAIGVQHQDHAPRAVQADGFANLLQHELTVAFMLWRGHALGATSDLDGIRIHYAHALQKLPEAELEAVVEAPQDGSVAMIFFTRSEIGRASCRERV